MLTADQSLPTAEFMHMFQTPRIFLSLREAPPGSILTAHYDSPKVPLLKFVSQKWATKSNILLVFLPLGALAHYRDGNAWICFMLSCIAIAPVAKVLGDTVDCASASFLRGRTYEYHNHKVNIGAISSDLLITVYGNAIELIVGLFALFQNNFRFAQTFMVGSILARLLLVLGCAFIAGFRSPEHKFNVTAAQTGSSLMTLSCITLIIPAAFHASKEVPQTDTEVPVPSPLDGSDPAQSGLLIISRVTAILLLLVYTGYLLFQLQTHHEILKEHEDEQDESTEPNTPLTSLSTLPSLADNECVINIQPALALLGLATGAAALCAFIFVSSVNEAIEQFRLHPIFVCMLLLPMLIQCPEVITIAQNTIYRCANVESPTVGLCVGGSIQIALLIVPLLVICGWIGREFTLFFANFETIVLSVSVVLVNLLIMDGKCNYLEGCMLLALYCTIGLAVFVS